MKKMISSLVLGMFLVSPLQATENPEEAAFKTLKEKISYSMGLDLGNYLQSVGEELDLKLLKIGIEDGYSGSEAKMTPEEITAAQQEFAAELKKKQEAELAMMKERNAAAGKDFLEANRKKEGVIVTKSGLQYEVLRKGDGPSPLSTDTVKVDYVGKLVSGVEFDSSIKRGEPVELGVAQVIPGWNEVLQLMQVGARYRVVVPSELAYGENGAPPVIEPNSVLVFEIDLLEIVKKEEKKEEVKEAEEKADKEQPVKQ